STPAEAWVFLIREPRPRAHASGRDPARTSVPAASGTPRFTVPLFALYGRDVREPGDPPLMAQLIARSGEDPAGWLARRVVAPMVRLWLHAVTTTGCVPEPHGQNTLVAFDPDGRRTAIVYRDCGVYVDPAIRAERGLTRGLPPVNVISRDVRQPRERVFSLTYDSFMGHHALDRLAQVAADTLDVDPERLRQAARETFAAGPEVTLPPTVHYYEDRLHGNGRGNLVDTGEPPARRGLHQRLVDELPQPAPDRVGVRGEELSHEHDRQLLRRVPPERGARRPAPAELALRAQRPVPDSVLHHREAEPEP